MTNAMPGIGPKRRKAMSVRISATGESGGQVMLALSFVNHDPRLTCQERLNVSREGGADLDCSMSVSAFAQCRPDHFESENCRLGHLRPSASSRAIESQAPVSEAPRTLLCTYHDRRTPAPISE